jgi:DNA-binding Xre family transcriptional regulator
VVAWPPRAEVVKEGVRAMVRFRLKELMERPGAPSQSELARRLRVPRQQVNRLVKRDIERIDLKTLDGLYHALGCAGIGDLLEYVPERALESAPVQAPQAAPPMLRAWMAQQLLGMLMDHVSRHPERGTVDPAMVRQAAHEFLDWALPGDLQSTAGPVAPEAVPAPEAAAGADPQPPGAPLDVDAVDLFGRGT